MSFGSFNEGGNAQPMADINTTPLVDVMLVLLVIFIITAPLFHQAVPIELPQVNSTKLDDKPLIVSVTIDGDGNIYVDAVEVERSALALRFTAATSDGQLPELHLRADRATRYERVTEVLAEAQRAGIVKIAFVTEHLGEPRQ